MNSGDRCSCMCICMHASPGFPNTTKPNLEIWISVGALLKNPIRKTSPRILQTTSHYPRQAFLSATPDEQSRIIGDIIQGLQALENINWGLETPFFTLDQIVSNRLSGIARGCAGVGSMCIRIRKLEHPLDDWIVENQGSVELNTCLGFIFDLSRGSPKDNKCYGLKSEKMESCESSCSICIESLDKNSLAIRMPCSHIFHGFCVFKWLQITPTCPLCRAHLFTSTII